MDVVELNWFSQQQPTTPPLHNFFKMPHFDFHNKSQEHLKEMDKCHNSCRVVSVDDSILGFCSSSGIFK